MSYSLLLRVREVARIARRLALLRACATVLSVILATTLILGTVDYVLRVQDAGTRILLTLAWLLAGGAAAWYWLVPVWRVAWSDLDVSRMIERRFPALTDRLSSALAFLCQPEQDVPAGSKSLMCGVIAETSASLEEMDLRDAIDPRATRKTLAVLLAVTGACFIFAVTQGSISWQAVRRLALPIRDDPWPRRHYLRFVERPTRMGRGEDLRLTVVDKTGELPDQVVVSLWFDDQEEGDADRIAMQRVDDAMVLQRHHVTRSFRYRATGGDDHHMPWTRLEVVEPPHLVQGKMEVTPPPYTGWSPTTHHEPPGSLRVMEGTAITISGRADRPLQAVRLRLRQGDGERVLSGNVLDAHRFAVPAGDHAPWIAKQSGEYSLELVDAQGTKTVDGDRWAVRVLEDRPPSLTLFEPSVEDLVTSRAVVSIRCRVQDDLALRSVALRFLRTDQSERGDQAVVLWEGPVPHPPAEPPPSLPPPPDVLEINYTWQLAPLSLEPGTVLSFHIAGEDYLPQSNQTMARQLWVVTESELIDRAGRRQSLVLGRLQQRLEQQRQAKERIDRVRIRLQEIPSVGKATLDQLQAAVMAQRQVNSALFGDDAEIVTELRRLRRMLDQSRIGDVDVRQKIQQTLNVVDRLGTQHLEPALRQSTSARQSLQVALDEQNAQDRVPEDVPPALEGVAGHQQAVVDAIEVLLDEMAAWDNYRRFAQEFSDLWRQQKDVSQATQEVAAETLALTSDQLDGARRAAIRGVASRQSDLARRMDRATRNLAQAARELAPADPAAATLVSDALAVARQHAISGVMRQAGRQIEQNRLGLATTQQQTIERVLEEMVDSLRQPGEVSSQEKVEGIGELGRRLEDLRGRQADMTDQFARAGRSSDPEARRRALQRLARRQSEIEEELRKTQRQLQRLQADHAAKQTGSAADSTERAGQAAQQGAAPEARQQSASAEVQLEAAGQSLQQAQQQAASALAREQGVRLPQFIEALIVQQEGVVAEVERLEELRLLQGQLTAAQTTSLAMVAEAQRAVTLELDQVIKQVSQLPSFVFALESVRETMHDVAQALEHRDISAETHSRAQEALDQLVQIREALEQENFSPEGQPSTSGDESRQPSAGAPDIELRIAQLKLLRGMQVAINSETRQLSQLEAENADDRRRADARLRRLADRQGRLAEILLDLIPPRDDHPALPEGAPADQDADQDPERPPLDALDRELDRVLLP